MTAPAAESRARAQADMLHNRLRKRARHVSKWARRRGITCYRLYDRDIPEVPLIIDWYEGHLHIARRRRGGDRPADGADGTDGEREWLELMAERAARALDVPGERVHIKERRRQRGRTQYRRIDHSDMYMVVGEGGHRFAVNLDDYIDTGLFLDHRATRARVEAEAAGARFLNLFCYTGSFTVYAAAGGARRTVSVDLSRRYLAWAERNMELNGLGDGGGPEHSFVCADAREYVRDRGGEPFDLAVLDPPTFSNSKKMRGVLDIQRDHTALIRDTLALLRPGGVLYFSTNARRFKLDATAIDGADIEDITRATLDEDFRARPAHRCWRMVRRERVTGRARGAARP